MSKDPHRSLSSSSFTGPAINLQNHVGTEEKGSAERPIAAVAFRFYLLICKSKMTSVGDANMENEKIISINFV